MDKSRHEIRPDVWLDCRRAVYLAAPRILCLADLHLGYHWAHRRAGQLMPLRPDDAAERLEALCASYKPDRVVLLGDVIHDRISNAAARVEFAGFLARVSACSQLEMISGNHDRELAAAVQNRVPIRRELRVQGCILIHGDAAVNADPSEFVISGHEHPAINLGDGVRSARFPCFLYGSQNLVLPAFSNWAAGCEIRSGHFMAKVARDAHFTHAIAIMKEKLLKVPLE